MEQFILWFLGVVGDFAKFMLSLKIIGDFSMLHFVLGGLFLIWIIKFFRFGSERSVDSIDYGVHRFGNVENHQDKVMYYARHGKGEYVPKHYYNPKHGGER